MQHARPNRLRRAVIYAALATLLGVVSLTLSQCTQVGDSLMGVRSTSIKKVSCKKQCSIKYQTQVKQENKYHQTQMHLCGSDAACKTAENNRHNAVLAQLSAERNACKANCHKQGAGTAG